MLRFPDFFITRPVGSGNSVANDVVRLRKALDKTGHGQSAPQPSGIYDSSLNDRVTSFQWDFGLKEDGQVDPAGPTERAITLALDAKDMAGPDAMEAIRAPFAALNNAGLKLLPDPQDRFDGLPRWVDAKGDNVPDEKRDAILTQARRNRQLKPVLPAAGQTPEPGTPVKVEGPPAKDDGLERAKPKKEAKDIEWETKQTLFSIGDEHTIRVKGPINIKRISLTAGHDGLLYKVRWLPIDAHGKAQPIVRGQTSPDLGGPGLMPGVPNSKRWDPPHDNPYGFEVRVYIPPQPPFNASSSGVMLMIEVPKGSKTE